HGGSLGVDALLSYINNWTYSVETLLAGPMSFDTSMIENNPVLLDEIHLRASGSGSAGDTGWIDVYKNRVSFGAPLCSL
ncbi:MAG: hypothetical protein AAGM22_18835, partial [Acidobacteriota bacterium]